MAKNDNLVDFLKNLADAIRSKKNIQTRINPQDFSREILSIQTSGVHTIEYVKAPKNDIY